MLIEEGAAIKDNGTEHSTWLITVHYHCFFFFLFSFDYYIVCPSSISGI